jgi:hypothetical protein
MIPISSTSGSDSVCETTPIYEALCGELLIDPEQVSREFDEEVIRWYAGRLPKPTG